MTSSPSEFVAAIVPPSGFLNKFRLVRAADQLDVQIELLNLVPELTGETFVLRQNVAGQPSGIILTLPPQHLLEYISGKPSRRIVADPTQLVFLVQPGQDAIPFSTEGILAALPSLVPNGHYLGVPVPGQQLSPERTLASLPEFQSAYALVHAAMAQFIPDARAEARSPLQTDAYLEDLVQRGTAQLTSPQTEPPSVQRFGPPLSVQRFEPSLPLSELRLSSRLVLGLWVGSESPVLRFHHAALPKTQDGRTELWHSVLASLGSNGVMSYPNHNLAVLRSEEPLGTITGWQTDVNLTKIHALSIDQARQIAAQAPAGLTGMLTAKRVHLTPHGATMEVRGDWPSSTTVKSWRHRTAIGRDQYDRIVEEGRLYPFGHKARKITTTERKIQYPTNGSPAKLMSRTVVEVLEPVRVFNAGDAIDRQFPFVTIELLSLEPPVGDFQPLLKSDGTPIHSDTGIVNVGSDGLARPFRYRCLALDRAGRPVTFDVPLVFVANTFPSTQFSTLATTYQARLDLSQIQLGGQTVTVADPGSPGLAATATPPDATDIIASLANLQVKGIGADFRPVVSEFTARVPGIERFTAVQEQLKVAYEESTYLLNGFGSGNPGEVLLKLIGPQPVLGLANKAVNGGLLSGVSFPATGLSRRLGPVGGVLSDVAKDVFNPSQWLGGLLDELKLLGVVPLKALMKDVATLAEAPIIAQSVIDGLRQQKMRWSTPLFPAEKFPPGQPQEFKVPDGFARLRPTHPGATVSSEEAAVLNVEAVVMHAEDGTMTATTTCTIQQVTLGIGLGPLDLVQVPFKKIAFVSVNGCKPDLDVVMGDITFHGILAFLGVLTRLIDKSGFHDPPALDITADGIRSSFSTPIPDVAVGMFSLANITFGAALDIPFKEGAPELFLNFATFENPFQLAVSALGGGGFLCITLSAASGLKRLEGALEFGASLSINLVVAKGAVSAMGGIYFRIEAGEALLTGYLRIAGILSVLGLI
ncbi:MAG: hypothetical protein WCD18_11880, partial [Thermosynechococcaceae cyanobacterium]